MDHLKNIADATLKHIIDLINSSDKQALNQLKLNQECLDIIISTNITHQDFLVLVVGKSLKISIDSDKFKQALVSTKKTNDEQLLLINFIKSGASFTCCKNFFSGHTNRNHWGLRKQLAVNEATIIFSNNKVDKDHLYQFLYQVEKNNIAASKSVIISAKTLYQYHQNNKKSLMDVYRNTIKFLETKDHNE